MNLDQALQTFLAESTELLEEMEGLLLALEGGPDDETLHALFRTAHTIKGSAGLFGFEPVVDFTHKVENVLGRLRDRQIGLDRNLSALLLACRDHIANLVAVSAGAPPPADLEVAGQALGGALALYLHDGGARPPARATGLGAGEPELVLDDDTWHISLRLDPGVLRNGMDPLSFIGYLGRLGELVQVRVLESELPPAAGMDPELCYLGFDIELRSDADKQAIEDVFEFLNDACELRILPPQARLDQYLAALDGLPAESPLRVGEILVESGAVTPREISAALARQQAASSDATAAPPRLGEVLVERGAAPATLVEGALKTQQKGREQRAAGGRFVRVDAERLSQLVNLVGELVIASANTQLLARRLGDPGLVESVSVFSHLVEEIRDNALQLRMVQIGDTLTRYQRVVHDVAASLGKQIDLVISGGETELDKAVVERLGDPLMHLVRNAMDHGIETPAVRTAAGKPERGTLRIHARHDSGNIVIQVADDGAGIDPRRVLEKAVKSGLVSPQQHPSQAEILRLVFEPGLSTAPAVTDLSGRGVGLDVVRRGIEALRGSVDLDSTPGSGTTFTISLPLTLAIIDGFLVGVGASSYVIPLDLVVECLELNATRREEIRHHQYLDLRGEVLPLLRLKQLFHEEDGAGNRENVVVVQYAGHKAGLLVDTLFGEFQTVIKPLGRVFEHLAGVSGATILGSGEVALILDVQALTQHAEALARARDGAGHGRALNLGTAA